MSMPIKLGPMKSPLNLTEWDDFCLRVLGRRVSFGTPLSDKELLSLGFKGASTHSNNAYGNWQTAR